jgi:hypothetical protein
VKAKTKFSQGPFDIHLICNYFSRIQIPRNRFQNVNFYITNYKVNHQKFTKNLHSSLIKHESISEAPNFSILKFNNGQVFIQVRNKIIFADIKLPNHFVYYWKGKKMPDQNKFTKGCINFPYFIPLKFTKGGVDLQQYNLPQYVISDKIQLVYTTHERFLRREEVPIPKSNRDFVNNVISSMKYKPSYGKSPTLYIIQLPYPFVDFTNLKVWILNII